MNKIDENIEQGIEAIENWVKLIKEQGYRTSTHQVYYNGEFYSFEITIRQKPENEND